VDDQPGERRPLEDAIEAADLVEHARRPFDQRRDVGRDAGRRQRA
jgi:hypothetical protein